MNQDKILGRYVKFFLLPGLILRIVLFQILWGEGAKSVGYDYYSTLVKTYSVVDNIEFVYYSILYSIFLIPFYDFFVVVFLTYKNLPHKSKKRLVLSVLNGLVACMIAAVITFLIGLIIFTVLAWVFGVPASEFHS